MGDMADYDIEVGIMGELENQLEELENLHQCLIKIRKAKREIMAEFGYKTWKSFDEVWAKVSGALTDEGIWLDGYRLLDERKPIYLKAGGKIVGYTSRPKLIEEKQS